MNRSRSRCSWQKAALLAGADFAEVELDFRKRRERPQPRKQVPEQTPGAKFGQEPAPAQDGDFEFYLLRLACLHPEAWPAMTEALAGGLRLEDDRARFLFATLERLARNGRRGRPAISSPRCPTGPCAAVRRRHGQLLLGIDWEKQLRDSIGMVMVRSIRRERALLDEEMRGRN